MLGIRLRNDWAYYALFQYFWILVILPKAVQLVCLGGLMCLIWFKSGREKPLDTFTLLQLIFLLIYGVACVVNALWGEHELARIFATVNTWTVNLIALALYHLYRHKALELRRLGKYCLINLVILIVLWLVFMFISKSPFAVFGHLLSAGDWVNGVSTPRFLGYLDYSNLVVFLVLFFYPLALHYLSQHRFWSAALTVALFFPVYSTNSRTGLVLYLVVLLAYALFGMYRSFFYYYRQRKYALLALAVLAVGFLAVILADQLAGMAQSLMGMREGSNSMRMLIYRTSLETMLEKSPVIGIGIKDMLDVAEYPLGSHSTYIGVFYKAGILGGSVYLVSLLGMAAGKLLGRDRDRHSVVSKLCMLAILLLMVFEDVDGANWCVCIFYILLALLENSPVNEHRTAVPSQQLLEEQAHE